jgi:sortase A
MTEELTPEDEARIESAAALRPRGRRRRAEGRGAQPRRRLSVVGVIGELLITAGVLVMLFLGWQLWLNNLIVGNQQTAQAVKVSQDWSKNESTVPAPVTRPDPGPPVVGAAPANAVQFANLIVPRFGPTWEKPIAEGIGINDVLNNGVGHYPGTQMPGDIGNVAFAAHRTGWGEPFGDIGNMVVGDHIYVEMEAGWYQYSVRSFEYVPPTGVGVLDPVPEADGVSPTDRIITLTSCNPKSTAGERIIVYGVYDTWYPRAGGPPAEIASLVKTAAAG